MKSYDPNPDTMYILSGEGQGVLSDHSFLKGFKLSVPKKGRKNPQRKEAKARRRRRRTARERCCR